MNLFHLLLGLQKHLLFCFLLLGAGLYAQTGTGVPVPTGSGKALYVAPTSGDDTLTREQNNINNPWATVHRAWYQARAGDVVYFRGGRYSPATVIHTKGNGFNGTSENPITFTNYPGEIAIIDGINTTGGANGEMFSIQKDFNSVIGTMVGNERGFQFINYVTCFFTGEDIGGAHFVVDGCRGIANRYGDNTGFVYTGADYQTVINNKISGCGTTGHLNTAGIFARVIRHIKILNNEIDNCVNGIYYKHPNDFNLDSDIEIAYNYVYNCLQTQLVCCRARIHDNIFTTAVLMGNDGGGVSATRSHADYNLIYNNTFYSLAFLNDWPAHDPLKGCTSNTIRDNIFGARQSWHEYSLPSPGYDYGNSTDYNLYFGTVVIRENRIDYTLQGWRNYQLNTHSRIVDANSLTGTPAFVGGATPTSIAGFALAAGSPGENAGSDGRDMGADVTKVGIQALGSLTITSPNGGESWRRGESHPITWTPGSATGNVAIELIQGSTFLGRIAESVAASTGTFNWTVGQMADGTTRTGTGLKIRIRSHAAPSSLLAEVNL